MESVEFGTQLEVQPSLGCIPVRRRQGVVMRAGSYPDKLLTVDYTDLVAAAARFQPVDIDLQHTDTILNGKLGFLGRVWVDTIDAPTLFGEAYIPEWLDELFQGEPIPVSCAWDRQQSKILRLSLVQTPRVDGAALFAAQRRAIAQEEDNKMTTTPAPTATSQVESSQAQAAEPTAGVLAGLLMRLFGQAAASTAATPVAAVASTPAPTPAPTPASDVNLVGRLQALEIQLAQERQQRFNVEAAAFAAQEVTAGRLLPAEVPGLVSQYVQALQDDLEHPVMLSADQPGISRVERLKCVQQARPTHGLTQVPAKAQLEGLLTLFSGNQQTGEAESGKLSAERREQLMRQTPLGERCLGNNGRL